MPQKHFTDDRVDKASAEVAKHRLKEDIVTGITRRLRLHRLREYSDAELKAELKRRKNR